MGLFATASTDFEIKIDQDAVKMDEEPVSGIWQG
jgi:hypothetical protein